MTNQESGRQSRILVEHPVYKVAIEEIRKELYTRWTNSDFSDVTNREEVFRLNIALELFSTKLNEFMLIAENEQTPE